MPIRCAITCTVFCDAEGVLLVDDMPHKVTARGLQGFITLIYFTNCLSQLQRSWPRSSAWQTCSQVTHSTGCFTWIQIWRSAPSTIFSWPDVAPGDYHVFPNLIKHLCALGFLTDMISSSVRYRGARNNLYPNFPPVISPFFVPTVLSVSHRRRLNEIIVKKLNSLKHLVRTTVVESHN